MKILIATDGSNYGQAAVDFATNIISQPDATEVKIITVIEPFALIEAETFIEATNELADMTSAAARQAGSVGKRLAEDFRERFSDTKIDGSNEVLGGPAARTIIEKAEEWSADLIVVGSHGYGFWERMFLGSVSNAIVHHAPCSVPVVRKSKPENGRH